MVLVPKADDFEQSRRLRGRSLPVGSDWQARFASPEDVILRKRQYDQSGGSEKHLRDIAGVVKIQGSRLDLGYLAEWSAPRGRGDLARVPRTDGHDAGALNGAAQRARA
jgi:hypothetical protein